MRVEINVPEYASQVDFQLLFEDDYTIKARIHNDSVVIQADQGRQRLHGSWIRAHCHPGTGQYLWADGEAGTNLVAKTGDRTCGEFAAATDGPSQSEW